MTPDERDSDERDSVERTARLRGDNYEAFVASLRVLIALEKVTVKRIEETRALIAELEMLLAKRPLLGRCRY
jgi:hypothetical protein